MTSYWAAANLVMGVWGITVLLSNFLFKEFIPLEKVRKVLALIVPILLLLPLLKFSFPLEGKHLFRKIVHVEVTPNVPIELKQIPSSLEKKEDPFLTETSQTHLHFNWVLGIFLLGIFMWFCNFLLQIYKISCICKNSILLKKVGGVRIYITQSSIPPFSFWYPNSFCIILPEAIILDPPIMQTTIHHELTHHRLRHTYLSYFLELFEALFFLNPASKIFKKICLDLFEFQCDQISITKIPTADYGTCLVHVATLLHSRPPDGVLAMATSNSQLNRRMQMLTYLGKTKHPSWKERAKVGLILGLLTGASLVCAQVNLGETRINFTQAQNLVEILNRNSNSHFNLEINEKILEHLNRYVNSPSGIDHVLTSKANLAGQEQFLINKLSKADIPPEFIAISFVEAGFASVHPPRYGNRSAGLWQFIPETAMRFGLKVNAQEDERYDVQKSTTAAIAFIQSLYSVKEFQGDWRLVILAYNAGEKHLLEAMKKKDTTDPWKLEGIGDQDYLARVMAAVIILKSPDLMSISHPLPEGQVTSPFGPRPPVHSGPTHFHSGIDFSAPEGTLVRCPKDGKVVEIVRDSLHGNTILVQHSERVLTKYTHLSDISVSEGQNLRNGDQLGTVGNLGDSTGPHLHFEFLVNAKAVDPQIFLSKYNIFANP